MPIVKTSSTYADEFNTGTSTKLNANVGDIITATHNMYYENTIDAGVFSDDSITLINTDEASPSVNFTGYDATQGYVMLLLNGALSSNITREQIQELVGKEITTLNFSSNFVGIEVLAVETNSITQGWKIVINDTTSVDESEGTGVIYESSKIENAVIEYAYFGNQNDSTYTPSLEINGNIPPTFDTTGITLDAASATVNNLPFKYNGAYQTGSLTMEGKGITTSGNIYNRQAFEIVHTIKATPISIYIDGDIEPSTANLPTTELNEASLFNTLGNSNYKLRINLKKDLTDLGSVIEERYDGRLSVVNQKFNGGNTDYSFTNFSIIRTSDSEVSDVPLVSAKFTVSFNVINTSDTPFLDTFTKLKVGIENVVESIDNTENYEQTFLNDEALTTLGSGAIAGTATGDAASITNATSVFNSTSDVLCTFDVDFTSGAEAQILAFTKYFFTIYVTVQDHTLNYTNSDRVTLFPFSGLGIANILVPPVVIDSTVFLPFKETLFANGIANTSIAGYPTQILVGITKFTIDWANRSTLRLNSINQQLVFVNSSTLEEFVVDSDTLNTSGLQTIKITSPTAYEYPLGGAAINKGFKIPATEVRNFISFINDGSVSDAHTFQIWFPFFLRWEYYTKLFLSSVPSSIIDNAEPYKGINFDLFRYDQLANWTLNYRLNFTSIEGVEIAQAFDYPITLVDYDADVDTVSREIKSYTEDETTELTFTGVKYIQNKDNTLIYVEWDTGSTVNDVSDFEIEILAEPKEGGAPNKIQRISSVNNLLASSWFTDNGAANGLVAKSISGNKAIGKVLIDKDKLSFFSEYRLYGNIDYLESIIFFTFSTESNVLGGGAGDTFDPSFTTINSEIVSFELIGGYVEATNTLSINDRTGLSGTPTSLTASELDGSCQDVTLTFPVTGSPSNITHIDLSNDDICGTLDVSLFDAAISFEADTNSSLTAITNPVSSALVIEYRAYSCNLSVLDLSTLTGLGGSFRAYSNSNLTSVINPTSTEVFNFYRLDNCNLTGTLDLSTLTGLGGTFFVYTNPNLTSVTNPISTEVFIEYRVNSCNLSTLDLSTLTGLGGQFRAYSNSNLTSITNPSTIEVFTYYRANSCNLSTLDLSGLTGLGGVFQMYANSNLTSITNPSTIEVFTEYWAYNCALTSLDFTPFTGTSNNIDIKLYSNALNATNCQTIIDDLATKGWTGITLNLATQTPVLTTIEKNALIASAGYITVVTTNSGTITL